jgi:hypothetical protein
VLVAQDPPRRKAALAVLRAEDEVDVDFGEPDSLFIGCFPIELFYEDSAPQLTELDFVPFDMCYGQWLKHSYDFPEDNRYS